MNEAGVLAIINKHKDCGWEEVKREIFNEYKIDKNAEAWRGWYRRRQNATNNIINDIPTPKDGILRKNVVLITNKEKVPIWLCTDIHMGDKHHLSDLFQLYLDYAKKTSARILLLGDMFNAAIPGASFPHAMFEQVLSPEEQLDALYEAFEPLKEQIDGVLEGNHEMWCYKATSLQMGRLLAQRLGVSHLQDGAYITYRVNNQKYEGFVSHGTRSLANPDKEMKDDRLAFGNPDFIAYGHDHNIWDKRDAYWHKGQYKEITLIRGGSFHGYSKYAQKKKLPPKPRGSAILYLYANQKILAPNTSNFIERRN